MKNILLLCSIVFFASCSAVLLTILLPKIGIMAYLITLIYGVAAGLLNGVIYTKVKIPSFIATLGAMSVWQSVAFVLSKGAPLQIKAHEWGYISWVKIHFGVLAWG